MLRPDDSPRHRSPRRATCFSAAVAVLFLVAPILVEGKPTDRVAPFEWKAGAASVKIIREGQMHLEGYAVRTEPAVWVAGYSNDVWAYLSSLRVLKEGGYEAGGAMKYFTTTVQHGPFSDMIGESIVGKVHELLGKLDGTKGGQ